MAPLYDSASLLASVKRLARRPANDQASSDGDWFQYLTEAQDFWMRAIAAVAPEENYGPPTLLTTPDAGATYTFGLDADGDPIEPLGHIELYPSLTGLPLVGGSYFDPAADYVLEGDRIRFSRGKLKLFGGAGPYSRFVKAPGVISATEEPVLRPVRARSLLPYRAAILWSEVPGRVDPAPYVTAESRIWIGDPNAGISGLLQSLKTREFARAADGLEGNWWDFIDSGEGYQRYGN